MSPIPPSLTAGALAPFRPEVRPPPPRVPKPIPEDRFYARPQPAPAAAPSSLPPKAAATHAPPMPRAQMAELGTQKVAVAELARRQLQRPPAGTGRTWHMTLKVTVPVPLYLRCVPHPPSARQSAECPLASPIDPSSAAGTRLWAGTRWRARGRASRHGRRPRRLSSTRRWISRARASRARGGKRLSAATGRPHENASADQNTARVRTSKAKQVESDAKQASPTSKPCTRGMHRFSMSAVEMDRGGGTGGVTRVWRE